jgi:hypothetical protein
MLVVDALEQRDYWTGYFQRIEFTTSVLTDRSLTLRLMPGFVACTLGFLPEQPSGLT